MLKSNSLTEYIKQKLNLPLDVELSDEDLAKITEISINGKDLDGRINDYDFKDFMCLSNLQYLSLQNFVIDNYETNIINRIKTIKAVQFTDCKMKSKSTLFGNIEMLSFTSCSKLDSKYFCNLKSLNTVKINLCGKVNLEAAKQMVNLKNIDVIDTKIK